MGEGSGGQEDLSTVGVVICEARKDVDLLDYSFVFLHIENDY